MLLLLIDSFDDLFPPYGATTGFKTTHGEYLRLVTRTDLAKLPSFLLRVLVTTA